jgi:hypothetical protein
VSAIRAIAAPAFWVPALDGEFIRLDIPQHRVFYSLPGIKQNLRALYDRFAGFAQRRNLRPVVAFIPPYQQDYTSGLIALRRRPTSSAGASVSSMSAMTSTGAASFAAAIRRPTATP